MSQPLPEPSRFPSYTQFLEYRAVIIRAIAAAWRDQAFFNGLKEDPIHQLHETFGYHYPFHFDLKVQDHSSTWTPSVNGGWTAEKLNSLELFLPPAPADKTQYLDALAAYGAKHISVLS